MKEPSAIQRPRQYYPKCGFAVNFNGQVDVLVAIDGENFTVLNPHEALDLHLRLQKTLEDLAKHLEKHNK
jgi:hypothetical protein